LNHLSILTAHPKTRKVRRNVSFRTGSTEQKVDTSTLSLKKNSSVRIKKGGSVRIKPKSARPRKYSEGSSRNQSIRLGNNFDFLRGDEENMSDIASKITEIKNLKLSNHLFWFINNPKYHDVVFNAENRRIYGHKFIICTRSKYLYEIIREQGESKEVLLPGISYHIMLLVLEFIYTGSIKSIFDYLTVDEIPKLANAIKKFIVNDISEPQPEEMLPIQIQLSIIRNLSVRNVLNIFYMAKESGWNYLRRFCLEILKSNPIIFTPDVLKDFPKEKISELKKLLKDGNDEKFGTVVQFYLSFQEDLVLDNK